ncbi:hypothetical protein E3Q08_03690 [Wallemia mellicola]|nr:hypothetical protein E3Q08_03690 [Wallemia mellicola]
MDSILKQFAQLTPLRNFNWYFNNNQLYDLQSDFIKIVINNETLNKYPPSVDYKFKFYKVLIQKLETVLEDDEMEVAEEIYDEFMKALSESQSTNGPPKSTYKTYFYGSDSVTLYEDQTTISKGTTGLVTWWSLSEDIYNEDSDIHKALKSANRVLELGSGCGLVGMAISKAFKDLEVFSTDVDDNVLSRLESNISLNNINNNKTLKLDWFHHNYLIKQLQPDIVIAADIIYDDYLFDPLIKVLEESLRVARKIFIRGALRKQETFDLFVTMLKQAMNNFDIIIKTISTAQRSDCDIYEILIGGN